MKEKALPVKDAGLWSLPMEADTQPVPGNLEGQESLAHQAHAPSFHWGPPDLLV